MNANLQLFACVALGGSAGALARFGIFLAIHRESGRHAPWTTMGVNLLGCLLLGLILGWMARKGTDLEPWRTFLTVGVLGAFTTFSTYAGDALRLIHEGKGVQAAAYLIGSAVFGLALCALGQWAGQQLASP